MSEYTTILFDADDTLFDFKRAEHEAVKDVLALVGLPDTDEIISKYSEINKGYWKMLERGEITKKDLFVARWKSFLDFYGLTDADAKMIANHYLTMLSQKCYLLNGAEELCEKLCGKFRLFIVTNGYAVVQHGRFDKSPIRKYFEDMFISEEMGAEKPTKAYFDAVFSRIPDFDPEKSVIIGDSLSSDIKGGINAGIDTCWYNPEGKNAPEGMNITYTVSKLSEIEDIV
jgi:2-haloacid dehalogenase